jgi:uncharacterized protein (DUF2235 family)
MRMKRIAIFCDGTWNTPDKLENGLHCATNVARMAEALREVSSEGIRQVLYYDTGIGSEGSTLKRVLDGATGSGISLNIRQAYEYLIQSYEPGDLIYMFGFSRGAFTVRSLAGLIRNSGILRKEHIALIPRAYSIYRSRKPGLQPREAEATLFRKTFAVEETTQMHFVGVWDTVGALGNPLLLKGATSKSNQFHDTDLSTKISHAYHALAIDEKRKNFQAALWHQQPHAVNQVLEQVWFAGVHSDVGGGYPENETGLSDIALSWMHDKAEGCGLEFGDIRLSANPLAKAHESYTGFYKAMPEFCRPMGMLQDGVKNTHESLHPSVLARCHSDPEYRPKNLTDFLRRNPIV